MFSTCEIEYANPSDLNDTYTLSFKLKDHNIAQKWATITSIANKKYSIDDRARFQGFESKDQQIARAVSKINQTIDVINSFEPLINRKLTDIYDQDTLNYLHHIFEVYHGLLDQQAHAYWNRAPQLVRDALAYLNLNVHECEEIRSPESKPAHFVTWYGMPKIKLLDTEDYVLFEPGAKKGTIYLLYSEIGKTLEHLASDNDSYIHDTAFKPFRHLTADIFVKFYDDDIKEVEQKYIKMKQYYDDHTEFFIKQGLLWGHPFLSAGSIPVAALTHIPDDLIEQLATKQWIKSIKLI